MLDTVTHLSDRLRRSAFAFPLAVLVAGLMMAISEFAYHEADSQLKRLSLIVQVRLEVSKIMRRITDAESGQRGYLLTDRPEYLSPYRDARRDVEAGLARLQDMYRRLDDPASLAKLKPMADDLTTKMSELDEVITLHDSGRDQAASALMQSGIGRDRMDTIRRQTDELLVHETSRISVGTANVLDTLRLGRIGVAAMTAVSLLLLGMFLRQSRHFDRERMDQAGMLVAERDRLEAQVHVRTAELTDLTRHLVTAREDERAKLARDLHDELGALLTAAKLDLARIRPKLQQEIPELLPRVAHLIETLNSGIALKRRIIEDLRPSTLDKLGLLPALDVLCQESGERLGVPVNARLAPVHLTQSAELTVFRMVQESLSNIAKYAKATRIDVQLEDLGEEACITVSDNGIGFKPDQVGAAHHGLLGMRYRVEAEQGTFSVSSTPGHGSSLRALLPQTAPQVRSAPDFGDFGADTIAK